MEITQIFMHATGNQQLPAKIRRGWQLWWLPTI